MTPEHLPLRYDARLFLARLRPDDAPEVWPGELAAGALVPVADALRRWSRGELLLHPPNLHALEVLARPGDPSVEALRAPPHCDAFVSRRIEFQQGFFLAALRTPTLPPATHTNAWLVPADGGLAVVDPGPTRSGGAGRAPRAARRARRRGAADAGRLAHARPPRSRRRGRARRGALRRARARPPPRVRPRARRRRRPAGARRRSPRRPLPRARDARPRPRAPRLPRRGHRRARVRRHGLDAVDDRHRPAGGGHGRVRAAARAAPRPRPAHALPGARSARAGRGRAPRRVPRAPARARGARRGCARRGAACGRGAHPPRLRGHAARRHPVRGA